MKTLVIGAHTQGIGDAFVHHWAQAFGLEGANWDNMSRPTVEDMNLRDPNSIEFYISNRGPWDHIVFSAGMSQLKWLKDLSWRDLDRVWDVNTAGAILVAASHVNHFPEHPVRYAVVVSDAAHTPMRGSIAYTTSKAALEMAVRNIGRELAPLWITVGVSPGVVEGTPMTAQLADEVPQFRGWTAAQAMAYEGHPPIGRRVTKQEVAETLWFALTGPEALNGSIITINGGK